MNTGKQPLLGSLTPFSRLIFAVLLAIACFASFFLAGMLLAVPLFGVSLTGMLSSLSDYTDPDAIRILEYFQVVQSFGLFIVPPLLAGWFFERNSIRYLALNIPSRLPVYLLTLTLLFSCLPFLNWLITVNESMRLPEFLRGIENWMKATEEAAADLTDAFMKMPSAGSFLFNLLLIALLPAIGEEFLFRGLAQRLFSEWLSNIHAAILVSAFLFSAMHFQFYGFLPRMMLGVMFGYLFYWTGSIWVPVFAHFINNGVAVIFSYLWQKGVLSGDYEDFGTTDNALLIALSLLSVASILWLVYRMRLGISYAHSSEDSANTT